MSVHTTEVIRTEVVYPRIGGKVVVIEGLCLVLPVAFPRTDREVGSPDPFSTLVPSTGPEHKVPSLLSVEVVDQNRGRTG